MSPPVDVPAHVDDQPANVDSPHQLDQEAKHLPRDG